jgi:hypothetical protein
VIKDMRYSEFIIIYLMNIKHLTIWALVSTLALANIVRIKNQRYTMSYIVQLKIFLG